MKLLIEPGGTSFRSSIKKGRENWTLIDGENDMPICLLEAGEKVDSGAVVYRERLSFKGHELINELREHVGYKSLELCLRYLAETEVPVGEEQMGDATYFARRAPEDSRMDISLSIADQFNLLRVVDNDRYPAWFEHMGRRYRMRIENFDEDEGQTE